MKRMKYPQPKSSEITPERIWRERRQLLAAGAWLGAGGTLPFIGGLAQASTADQWPALPAKPNNAFMTMQAWTDKKDVTTYNNFYEFGLDKSDPARYAGAMKVDPWTVQIEGEVAKPGTYGIEDLLSLSAMEERVYRMRCVEGWSMVIPWIGYPLSDLLNKVEPTGNAKYVTFVTDEQPDVMRGLSSSVIDWPYQEGLRMDEAMHPLTLLTFGLYGMVLPNQNGAPVRVVVPWKYGFKSGKSIVKILVTEKQPTTSWMRSGPSEYGFYANVNPDVSHPRWSQATERRIGEGSFGGFFAARQETRLFNGYADQVASLYAGMDLAKNF
jgi:sulfoxide reductase catalytic subunit YedY